MIGVRSRVHGVDNPRLGFLLPLLGGALTAVATGVVTGFATQAINRVINPPPSPADVGTVEMDGEDVVEEEESE